MVVIYAEKASLARTIAETLNAGKRIMNPNDKFTGHWEFDFNGESAVIVHGAGHLAGLAKPEQYDEKYKLWDLNVYPCIPQNYKIIETNPLLKYVGNYMKKADWLINATDPDREGELIFAYVCEALKLQKPWKRVLLTDLTTETIKKAFANLKNGSEMLPMQYAGKARAVADWLFGMNLTVAATKMFGTTKNIMTVGRVQTATLNLIVKRENDVKNHVKTPFWKVLANFQGIETEHIDGKFSDKNIAQKIISEVTGKQGTVTKKEINNRTENAPLLYNSTGLQSQAGNKLGFDLDKTQKIMQKLYEKGLITYPRTSTEHLPETMYDDVTLTVDRLFSLKEYEQYKPDKYADFTKRHFDTSKVGSHTAIIPTMSTPKVLSELDNDDRAVYDLIAKSVLRIVLGKAEYEETEIEITVENHIFKAKESIITFTGWRILEEKEKTNSTNTSKVTVTEQLNGEYTLFEGVTEPPKRYTESSLILAMETCGQHFEDEARREIMKREKKGLGTDATRPNIVKTLFDKEYIEKKGKSLYPTDKGIFLIAHLKNESLKSAETTGEWEKQLSDISESDNAEKLYQEFLAKTIQDVLTVYYEIKTSAQNEFRTAEEKKWLCPLCGRRMIKSKFSWSCSGYKETENQCIFAISYEMCGKKITESQAETLITNGKTMVVKNWVGKSGKKFDAALKIDKEKRKVVFDFPDTIKK